MAALPREDFVPEAARAGAYTDRAVPLGDGRFLAAPLVHGLMLAEAAPTPADKALLVGSGSAYLAALLKPLVASLEVVDAAALAADLSGATLSGPYSLIIVDGAAEELPASLTAALATDGRLVTGVVERGLTRLATARKVGDTLALLPLAEIGIPVLAEFAAPRRWSF
jgi:protein-L-isoaspartate(D-aspartate) O-methyltransferase